MDNEEQSEITIPDEEQYQIALDREEARKQPEMELEEEIDERLPYEITIDIDTKNKHDQILLNSVVGISEVISRGNYFATDAFTGELYVFIDHGKYGGTYIEANESLMYAIRTVSDEHFKGEIWARINKRKEVYHWINTGLRKLENPDLRHLNVANGLIYLTPEGEFMDFSEEWSSDVLTTVKLPVRYDPEAKCPIWEKFISEIFPPDSQHVAWQLAALLMIPLKNKAASAVILKGEKNTGKTTFQNGIISFIGTDNVSNLSLDRFGERFQDTQLKGKLANVVGEMPNSKLNMRAVNTIKKLIGNDWLSGEIKNGASFKFLSYARCLFSCNEMPTCDSDDAFFDRFIIIPFKKQFSKNPENEKLLNEALSSPEELSGLLNKALVALPSVMKQGIQSTETMQEAHDLVVEENDPLMGWFKEYVEVEPFGSSITIFRDLHRHYKEAEPQDRARQSDVAFGRALKKLLPTGVYKRQIALDDGSKPYGFIGMKLKEAGEELDQTGYMEFDLEKLDDDVK